MVRSIPPWLAPCLAIPIAWAWYRIYAVDYSQGGQWGCEMSWMTPSYIPIDTTNSPISRYKLYLYRENGWDDTKPTGHPVIFIPGNAGSYQQARSIASSTSRQYHGYPGGRAGEVQGAMQIDMFTLDLNEDFSAFHGAMIRDQAAFLVYSVHRVLNLYDASKNVTLLGHSMGGIVARLAMNMGIEDAVDAILTMSTPHLLAPVTLDAGVEAIYRNIQRSIRPALLSVCGGVADSQIASDSCAINLEPSEGFTVFTTSLPGAWTGVDHQAMVWCHQVRWRMARVLLAMTTVSTKVDRIETAAKWLLPGQTLAESGGSLLQEFSIEKPTTFLTSQRPDSVQVCHANDCHTIGDAHLEQFPIPKNGQPFPVSGEGSQSEDMGYALTVNVSGMIRLRSEDTAIVYGSHIMSTSRSNIWTPSDTGANVRVHFPRLSASSLVVYRVFVDAPACPGFRPVIKHTSVSVGNIKEERYFPVDAADILLHSHSGSAPFISSRGQGLVITIYQSPECGVRRLEVRREFWRSLAKAVTRFRMAVIAWSLGWAAVIAAVQFEHPGISPTRAWVDLPIRHVLWVYLCLLSVGILQPLVPFEMGRHLLLGTDDLDALLLHACITTWTMLSSLTVVTCFRCLAFLSLKIFSRKDRMRPLTREVIITGLSMCSSMILVPQEVLLVLVFVYQVFVSCSTGCPLAGTGCLLMFHLLPFNIAPTASWMRAILADWRAAPNMGQNPLLVVPPLCFAMLSGHPYSPCKRLEALPPACLRFLGILCFVVGPRHTYVLPGVSALAMVAMSTAMWPSGAGKTRQ